MLVGFLGFLCVLDFGVWGLVYVLECKNGFISMCIYMCVCVCW